MAELDLTCAVWHKSSRSSSDGACVEVAVLATGDVGVRDSKAPEGGVLVVSRFAWRRFLSALRDGSITDR